MIVEPPERVQVHVAKARTNSLHVGKFIWVLVTEEELFDFSIL